LKFPQYFQHLIRFNRGFSLIELMVVIGISSIVTLAVTSAIQNMILGQNHVDFRMDVSDLHRRTTDFITFQSNQCACNFNGITLPATPVATDVVNLPSLTSRVDPTDCTSTVVETLASTLTPINGMTMQQIAIVDMQAVGATKIKANLRFAARAQRMMIGPNILPDEIAVWLNVVPAGPGVVSVQSCSVATNSIEIVPFGTIEIPLVGNGVYTTYTVPGIDPAARAIMVNIWIDRDGQNPDLELYNMANSMIGEYGAHTGSDGHIAWFRGSAMIPLEAGQFKGRCNRCRSPQSKLIVQSVIY
jgi:prepilin-type N-terminal cleavage/methylation domain-containing protein